MPLLVRLCSIPAESAQLSTPLPSTLSLYPVPEGAHLWHRATCSTCWGCPLTITNARASATYLSSFPLPAVAVPSPPLVTHRRGPPTVSHRHQSSRWRHLLSLCNTHQHRAALVRGNSLLVVLYRLLLQRPPSIRSRQPRLPPRHVTRVRCIRLTSVRHQPQHPPTPILKSGEVLKPSWTSPVAPHPTLSGPLTTSTPAPNQHKPTQNSRVFWPFMMFNGPAPQGRLSNQSPKNGRSFLVLFGVSFGTASSPPPPPLRTPWTGSTRNTVRTFKCVSPINDCARVSWHSFWNKDLFEAFRAGNWSTGHPLQQGDFDHHFSVFAFILSVEKTGTWPPRIPADGITIADMAQLGRNLMWFLDLALAQPGVPGSLLLEFSLVGEALSHQFELLEHRPLGEQWDATSDSKRRHTYTFLLCTHRLFVELHRWFCSFPLVFHVSPMDHPQSQVMALSPLIANRRGSQGNLWNQRTDWLKIIDGVFRDNFDSSQALRNSPPAWILRSSSRGAGAGFSQLMDSYLPTRAAGTKASKQGEKQSTGPRALRDRDPPRPSSPTPVPVAVPAPVDEPVPTITTKHPLFALSPDLASADKKVAPGGLLYKLCKSLAIPPPKYGSEPDIKQMCFNFTTDGWCKCSGIFDGKNQKKRKPCYRLHVSLDADGPHSSDPAAHFVDVVRFLQKPGVADFFIPSDEFATSQQYRDALALL